MSQKLSSSKSYGLWNKQECLHDGPRRNQRCQTPKPFFSTYFKHLKIKVEDEKKILSISSSPHWFLPKKTSLFYSSSSAFLHRRSSVCDRFLFLCHLGSHIPSSGVQMYAGYFRVSIIHQILTWTTRSLIRDGIPKFPF